MVKFSCPIQTWINISRLTTYAKISKSRIWYNLYTPSMSICDNMSYVLCGVFSHTNNYFIYHLCHHFDYPEYSEMLS